MHSTRGGEVIIPLRQYFGSAFMSALGGALSLYLGLNIAMVIEVAEFVAEMAANLLRYGVTGKMPQEKRGGRNKKDRQKESCLKTDTVKS